MKGKPKKSGRDKDITADFLSGHLDEDRLEREERFGQRSRNFQQRKTERTTLLRAGEEDSAGEIAALPTGQVTQVFSRYCEVEHEARVWLCVVRRTLTRAARDFVVVGDFVRFRATGTVDEDGRPEAVVEAILPRQTVLTRADSFKAIEAQPIVANAEQMLIVAALAQPWPKWGLIDRMLIAAQAGGLVPLICLNKIDLVETDEGRQRMEFAQSALDHYGSMGVTVIQSSAPQGRGIDELRQCLRGRTTVLAGHSGVGKSSLISAVQPSLDLRVGEISRYTGKGRHTTTSARRYPLEIGGFVIDTPGVKLFGLWNVMKDNLIDFFPDVDGDRAPEWRVESYERILESLAGRV